MDYGQGRAGVSFVNGELASCMESNPEEGADGFIFYGDEDLLTCDDDDDYAVRFCCVLYLLKGNNDGRSNCQRRTR